MNAEIVSCGSLYNEHAAQGCAGRRVQLFDLSLEGDGEEMAGVNFASADRLELARRLDAIGVDRLALLGNSPEPTSEQIDDAGAIADLGLKARLFAFTKTTGEIELAKRLGLEGAVILIAVNPRYFLGDLTPDGVIATARRLCEHAKALNLHTTIMAMDATRTEPGYLERFLQEVAPAADEVALGDSLGVASPWGIERLVGLARTWTDRPLQVHCHNHAGVGVANGLAAVRAGADIVHVTVNGLGEFAGLLALEELAVALPMHLDCRTGIETAKLTDLCRFVAEASGIDLPPHKPVVGRGAFTIPETEEIQVALDEADRAGLLDEALTVPPARVGQVARMGMGRLCGPAAIAFTLRRHGFRAELAVLASIAKAVRERSAPAGAYDLLDDDGLFRLIDEGGFRIDPGT